MKIRIKGNSLRLRLSQTEVNQIKEKGMVSDQIDFGLNKLVYQLRQDNIDRTLISFINDTIEILVPDTVIFNWMDKDEVGFEEDVILPNETILKLLVEKDFQCLTVRRGEDESDLFQNPAQSHEY